VLQNFGSATLRPAACYHGEIQAGIQLSGIPNEIPDLGSATTRPRQNPEFVPGSSFSAEEYYVWTRCDGTATLREIILMLGRGVDHAVAILTKLEGEGAIVIPGAPKPAASSPTPAPAGKGKTDRDPDADETGKFALVELDDLDDEERAALVESVDLPEAARRRIIEVRRKLENYFELLGVEPGVGKRQLKRAYFRLSKEFHPDRHYSLSLGSFGPWLREIFQTATRAFNELSDDRRRRAYEARLDGTGGAEGGGTQTREEHAAELFERACDAEIAGDSEEALKLFAAVCRINPKPAYISRAARCALRAEKLSTAEEYAKKAAGLRPKDPSYARLLADIHRAAGRLGEAEATLLHAIELNSENDVLMAELRSDLEAIKRSGSTGAPAGGGRGRR
jgi:hypothetical protein